MGNNDIINEKLIDLELAKSDNKNSTVRKFLPAVVLMGTAYYSALLALGLLVGYVGSRIFTTYLIEQGKVDCIYIDMGKWKVHMHHWIMGGILLFLLWFVYQFNLGGFFAGVIFGVMAHDVYDFNDWHKVLVRKEV